jgi:hypothetical protein
LTSISSADNWRYHVCCTVLLYVIVDVITSILGTTYACQVLLNFFFPHLKRDLKGTNFTSDDEVKQAVTSWIKQRTPEFLIDGIRKLVLRWGKMYWTTRRLCRKISMPICSYNIVLYFLLSFV